MACIPTVERHDGVFVVRVDHGGNGDGDDLIQTLPPDRRAKVEERALPRRQRPFASSWHHHGIVVSYVTMPP
jgi:hypothetical protein